VANLEDFRAVNAREEAAFSRLVEQVAPAPVSRVPLLDIDVHDAAGLAVVADHVFGAPSVVGASGAGLA
jgi:hypothetical protein